MMQHNDAEEKHRRLEKCLDLHKESQRDTMKPKYTAERDTICRVAKMVPPMSDHPLTNMRLQNAGKTPWETTLPPELNTTTTGPASLATPLNRVNPKKWAKWELRTCRRRMA